MTAFYVAVTIVTATANAFAAYLDFSRNEQVIATMKRKAIPESWTMPLGALKAAGALGLLLGFAIPPLGTAAAIGLVLFFIGAVIAHLRVRFYRLANAAAFLSLAVITLTVNVAHHGGL